MKLGFGPAANTPSGFDPARATPEDLTLYAYRIRKAADADRDTQDRRALVQRLRDALHDVSTELKRRPTVEALPPDELDRLDRKVRGAQTLAELLNVAFEGVGRTTARAEVDAQIRAAIPTARTLAPEHERLARCQAPTVTTR